MAEDARYSTVRGRLEGQDALDAVVAEWTGRHTSYQVMEILQSVGVPAGPVLTAGQALADPHFRQRGFFERVDHPAETGLGSKDYIGRGWKFSGSKAGIDGPAPLLGEANDYALREVLGLSAEQVDALTEQEVIGVEPSAGARRRRCRWTRRWSWGGSRRLTRSSRGKKLSQDQRLLYQRQLCTTFSPPPLRQAQDRL